MPLLSFPELTQGYARFILIGLYLNHPAFAKELNEVKNPYIEAIRKYIKGTSTSFQEMICSPKIGTEMKRFFRNAKIQQKEQTDEKISIRLGTDRLCSAAS